MSQTERLCKIDRLLQARGCVPLDRMLEELGISRATFKRDIEYMRSRFHVPIEWDRNERGYKYEGLQQAALPGLWFNSSEAYALLMMQSLLTEMTPGLLGAHIAIANQNAGF
ncbi:MAG: HTH domain-containing protein [Rhodoferax sp.]